MSAARACHCAIRKLGPEAVQKGLGCESGKRTLRRCSRAIGYIPKMITKSPVLEPGQKHQRPLAHFEKFKPYAFRPLKETHFTSVRQHPFFEYFDTVSLDLRHLTGEVVGIDSDVFQPIELR